MKKKSLLLILAACVITLIMTVGSALAFTMPVGYFEFDLDNYTRLYDSDGILLPLQQPAQLGDVSKTVFTFNDLSFTRGPGGTDYPPFWSGGDNGEYLIGIEKNVAINKIVNTAPREQDLYFNSIVGDGGYEFELYVTDIDLDELEDSILAAIGPGNWTGVYDAITAPARSTLILAGDYALSTYALPGGGFFNADFSANISDWAGIGGAWNHQVTMPYGLMVDAFVDIDPNVGIGGQFLEGLYGTGPDDSPYDMAIQNVRLMSETMHAWVVSDDGVRAGTIPEPATMLLLGSGLLGLAGFSRRKFKKKK